MWPNVIFRISFARTLLFISGRFTVGNGTDWILVKGSGRLWWGGRGSGNYNGNECGSGMRLRPGCREGFIKYGTAVIWSGPRGYWPPREEITVKRAGETTSWWMYYLCKGLIDEAGDSFTEEASARSNLISPHLPVAPPSVPPPLPRCSIQKATGDHQEPGSLHYLYE